MRNLKKFLALVLAMIMCFSLMITANAATVTYGDSKDITAEFKEAVDVLSGIGVMKGDAGNFNPASTITRAEAATVMYRIITGDANDEKVSLYNNYGNFSDVKSSDWFAGYVGYCANHGIIQGNGYGEFLPYDKIDGYQMLTMLLRAIGYQNLATFSGSDWRTQVASGATQLGLLKDVNGTRYGGDLYTQTRRDVVASMTFQAIQKPMVIDNGLGSYTQYKSLVSNELNDSLGMKWFGLTKASGIIVGNQSTGEKNTLVGVGVKFVPANTTAGTVDHYELSGGVSYVYAGTMDGTDTDLATSTALTFKTKTGLDKFGHKVDVWFDSRTNGDDKALGANTKAGPITDNFGTVYTVRDLSTRVDAVYAIDQDLTTKDTALNKAVKGADFTIDTTNGAYQSDAFAPIGSSKVTTTVAQTNGDSNVYLLISNSAADANGKNALDLIVSLKTGLVKVDAKNDYNSPKNVTLKDDSTATDIDRSADSPFTNVLVYGESAIKVNTWVVVNEIAGTGSEFGNTAGTMAQLYGIDAITKTVKGKITSISANGTVTLDGKEEVAASALWETTATAKANRGNGNLLIGNTVTLYLDKYGKYVRVTAGGGDDLMGAYAYWQQEGIDGIKYYIQGVNDEGEIVTKEINQESYFTQFAKKAENTIPIHHMRNTDAETGTGVGSNLQIVDPDLTNGTGYKSYFVDDDGSVTADPWTDITTLPAFASWTKDSKTLDDSDATCKYFFTDETEFHVVTGWGSTLKVEHYTGLTALMKGADSVVAQGYYFLVRDDTEQSGSQNFRLDTLILVNTKWIQPNSFLYVGNTASDAVAATKDSKAHQFQVYTVGKDTEASILIADDTYPNTTGTAYTGLTANTFYTYTMTAEGYYQPIADAMDGTEYGVQQKTLDRTSNTNGGTAFGYITDGTDKWYALNAIVLDVSGSSHGITNYETLRRAAERNDITVDILLTSMGGDTASVIYVTSVTPYTAAP